MLKALDLVTVVVVIMVIGVGALDLYAQLDWKTYYNPQYRFAIDYHSNDTIPNTEISNDPKTLSGKFIPIHRQVS